MLFSEQFWRQSWTGRADLHSLSPDSDWQSCRRHQMTPPPLSPARSPSSRSPAACLATLSASCLRSRVPTTTSPNLGSGGVGPTAAKLYGARQLSAHIRQSDLVHNKHITRENNALRNTPRRETVEQRYVWLSETIVMGGGGGQCFTSCQPTSFLLLWSLLAEISDGNGTQKRKRASNFNL